MKNYLVIALIAIVLYACGRGNYVQQEGFCMAQPEGDTVVFGLNIPVSLFTACGDNISASVTRFSDSRCPPGVNCVWAGKLDITLEMGGMRLELEKDKVIDTFYRDHRYSFFLVNALPEPSTDSSASAASRRIFVKITRANRSKPVEPDNTLPVAADSSRRKL